MLTIHYAGHAKLILTKPTAWTFANTTLTCHSAGPRLPGPLIVAKCTSFNNCSWRAQIAIGMLMIRYAGLVKSILAKQTAWTSARTTLACRSACPRLLGPLIVANCTSFNSCNWSAQIAIRMLTTHYAGPAKSILTKPTAWTLAKPTLTCRSAGPRLPVKVSATYVNSLSFAKW
jgi:hypothetical protein